MPVIGISAGYVRHNDFIEGSYIHQDFVNSISKNGGLPIIIPFEDKKIAIETLKLCNGIMISGGEDIHPKFYGQEPNIHLGTLIPERDEVEISMVKYAIEHDVPLFAICRGLQILNVALGGTLFQDIPSQIHEPIQHFQKGYHLHLETHSILIKKESKLFKILGEETVRVNSFHHQAIDRLGENLKTVALSTDGVIEAVEHIDHFFAMGVQFHPEFMTCTNNPLMNKLFSNFIELAYQNSVKS